MAPYFRILKDRLFENSARLLVFFCWFLLIFIFILLLVKSLPILRENPLSKLFFSENWHPMKGKFGFLPFITGTVWVTFGALILAVPVCLLTGIYLSEYASKTLRNFFIPMVDLLAGIPSVVFGLWGVLVIVPWVKETIAPYLGINVSGYSMLSASIVLAVMIIPVMVNIFVEIFRTVPVEIRMASLAVGATKWETVKNVILRKNFPGIVAGVVLAMSRAFGETMAVLMVAGNVAKIPHSIFDPVYPLPALIANSYGEMLSIPLFDSALMLAALILLAVVIFFNVVSRWMLLRIEKGLRL